MSNFSVIKSIERETAGVFYPVSFQPASAEYECKRSKSNHGYLYKYTVTFKIAGLTDENQAELGRISRCDAIRIRDVNGAEVIIGSWLIRLIVTWEDSIEGKPGSFRGTVVKIEWNTMLRAKIRSFI